MRTRHTRLRASTALARARNQARAARLLCASRCRELVGDQLLAAMGARALPGMIPIEASCVRLAEDRSWFVLDN